MYFVTIANHAQIPSNKVERLLKKKVKLTDERRELAKLSQVKAALHPLREQMLQILVRGPHTPSEVGRRLGISASKAHYHVRVLEQNDLVRLVETRTTNGITEKFYEATAQNFTLHVEPHHHGGEGAAAVLQREVQALIADIVRSAGKEAPPNPCMFMGITRVQAGPAGTDLLRKGTEALMEQVGRAAELAPDRWYRVVLAWVPMEANLFEEEPPCSQS